MTPDVTPEREAEIRDRLQALRDSAAEAAEAPAPDGDEQVEQQVQMVVHQLDLKNVNIGVGDSDDGTRWLVVGPIGLHLRIPLNQAVAGEIGAALTGGTFVPRLNLDPSQLGVDADKIAAAAREALKREAGR